jgi:hypothetical protein
MQFCSRLFWSKANGSALSSISRIPRVFPFGRQIVQQPRAQYSTISAIDEDITQKIRNFAIIAHIDHGKTSLSNQLLQETGTISRAAENELYLDKLKVEKERGITVKAHTCSMIFKE